MTSRNSALSPPKRQPGDDDAPDGHAAAAVDVGVGEEPVGHGVGEGEGGQGQVEVAQPDGGQGDQGPDRGADHGGGHQPEHRAAAGDLAHDEGADAHEGELAQRDLARVAGEQDQGQADDAQGHHHAAQGEEGGALERRCCRRPRRPRWPRRRRPTPATRDSLPPATRGARMVVSRPTARSRTEGRVTRAMNRNDHGQGQGDVRHQALGEMGQDVVDDVVLGQADADGGDEGDRDVLQPADDGRGVAVDHQQGHGLDADPGGLGRGQEHAGQGGHHEPEDPSVLAHPVGRHAGHGQQLGVVDHGPQGAPRCGSSRRAAAGRWPRPWPPR